MNISQVLSIILDLVEAMCKNSELYDPRRPASECNGAMVEAIANGHLTPELKKLKTKKGEWESLEHVLFCCGIAMHWCQPSLMKYM